MNPVSGSTFKSYGAVSSISYLEIRLATNVKTMALPKSSPIQRRRPTCKKNSWNQILDCRFFAIAYLEGNKGLWIFGQESLRDKIVWVFKNLWIPIDMPVQNLKTFMNRLCRLVLNYFITMTIVPDGSNHLSSRRACSTVPWGTPRGTAGQRRWISSKIAYKTSKIKVKVFTTFSQYLCLDSFVDQVESKLIIFGF